MVEAKKRILIVDDDREICGLLAEIISGYDYEVDQAYDGQMALDTIALRHYGVVIADLAMPRLNGNQLLEEINALYPDTSVIIITAHASYDNAIASLRASAFDFIKKPLPDHKTLMDVINAAYKKYEKNCTSKINLNNLVLANERLQEKSVTDGLTKLYNFSYFHERLNEEVKRSRRYNSPLSLIFVDIDNFKHINDSFGHQKGDFCLQEVARVLLDSVRDSDIVARYGGEEFVIILPNTEKKQAVIMAERLRQEVEEKLHHNHKVSITISGGVALFPAEAKSMNKLISLADERLHIAKIQGKNRIIAH